jgi:hypothetical protein
MFPHPEVYSATLQGNSPHHLGSCDVCYARQQRGNLALTAAASFKPCIEPGMSMSVKNEVDVFAGFENGNRLIERGRGWVNF